MRVSIFEKFGVTNHYFGKIQNDLAQQQFKMATGKNFNTASDDPIKFNQALLIQGSQDRINQMQKNIGDATSFLNTAESVLGSSVEILQESRTIGLQAANGTFNDSDRQSFVTTIEQNIQQMITLSNTKHLNRYIFSGENTQTPAFTYDGATATYGGDSTSIKFDVSPTYQVDVSTTGDIAFQNVLDSLIDLRNKISTGVPADINASVGNLDIAMEEISNVRSGFGIRTQTLDHLNETYEKTKTDLQVRKSNVEDADMTELVMEFAKSQQLYQGTIQSSMKMFETSILNYI